MAGTDDRSRNDAMRVLREAAPYLGLGTSLAVTIGLAVGFGYWLDERFGTKPILTTIFGLFGAAVALVHFVRAASRMTSKTPGPA
jgi:F0F1-type ATP synthase assembly protein I